MSTRTHRCAQCDTRMHDPMTTALGVYTPFCTRDCWEMYYAANARPAITIWCDDKSHDERRRLAARLKWDPCPQSAIGGHIEPVLTGQWVLETHAADARSYGPNFVKYGRICAEGHRMDVTPGEGRAYEAVCLECGERVRYSGQVLNLVPPKAGRRVSMSDGQGGWVVWCACGQNVPVSDANRLGVYLERAHELGQHELSLTDFRRMAGHAARFRPRR